MSSAITAVVRYPPQERVLVRTESGKQTKKTALRRRNFSLSSHVVGTPELQKKHEPKRMMYSSSIRYYCYFTEEYIHTYMRCMVPSVYDRGAYYKHIINTAVDLGIGCRPAQLAPLEREQEMRGIMQSNVQFKKIIPTSTAVVRCI